MSSDQLPKQPDAAAQPSGEHPSIWLYAVLLAVSAALVVVGFSFQDKPDWGGLLLNVAAGFIGSVVVLVFVDRRLRASEVQALTRLPAASGLRVKAMVFPTHRLAFRYCRSLLKALEPNLKHVVRLPEFDALDTRSRTGFVLTGVAGIGKTTWTQLSAYDAARRYLAAEPDGRVTLLLPLARWLPDRTLHRALFESVYGYVTCSEWMFDRLLRSGLVVVILDGYDELWNRELPFVSEHATMKEQFPRIAWVVTSRSNYPLPTGFGPTHQLMPPTEDQVAVIRSRALRGPGAA